MRKIILKAMALCVMCSFCVGTAFADESEWTFDPATGTISSYTGPGGHVEIPETYMGFPVTRIGRHAFVRAKGTLTSVTMPDSVTHIEEGAFKECRLMTSINFSQNLVYIGEDGIRSCDSVTEWIFPDSLTTLYSDSSSTWISTDNTTYIRLPANTVSGTFNFGNAPLLEKIDIPDEFVGEIILKFNVDLISEATIPGGTTLVHGAYPARYELNDNGNYVPAEQATEEFTFKVYDNTPAHFFCVEQKFNFELLGEWVQPTAGSSATVDTPSTSTPSTSTPSASTPSAGSSASSSSDGSDPMVTLAIIAGVTIVLCVGVVVIFMKKK